MGIGGQTHDASAWGLTCLGLPGSVMGSLLSVMLNQGCRGWTSDGGREGCREREREGGGSFHHPPSGLWLLQHSACQPPSSHDFFPSPSALTTTNQHVSPLPLLHLASHASSLQACSTHIHIGWIVNILVPYKVNSEYSTAIKSEQWILNCHKKWIVNTQLPYKVNSDYSEAIDKHVAKVQWIIYNHKQQYFLPWLQPQGSYLIKGMLLLFTIHV